MEEGECSKPYHCRASRARLGASLPVEPNPPETVRVRDTALMMLAIALDVEPLRTTYDTATERCVMTFLNSPAFQQVRQQFTDRSAVLNFSTVMNAVERVRMMLGEARRRARNGGAA